MPAVRSHQHKKFLLICIIICCLLPIPALAAPPKASPSRAADLPDVGSNPDVGDDIPQAYIAILKRRSTAEEIVRISRDVLQQTDVKVQRLHTGAVSGFSFTTAWHESNSSTPEILRVIRGHPEIDHVVKDYMVQAAGPAAAMPSNTILPNGIKRIGATLPTGAARFAPQAATVAVAIIDTGIELRHPDLDVVNGINCVVPGRTANDDNGHGTHVAGIVAAKNNGLGVVGVAPGTKVVAVKVLNGLGVGTLDSIICGINWVVDNAAARNIKVMVLSYGGFVGYSGDALPAASGADCGASGGDPMRAAICAAVAAGITPVAAAGNEGMDFGGFRPAAYPEVLTVTAMTDSDGVKGGFGPSKYLFACPYNYGADDTIAAAQDTTTLRYWASNYANGSDATAVGHTIAAPGVCVFSTWIGWNARWYSGTSAACAHVAGIAALCHGNGGVPGPCSDKTPSQVIQYIRSKAEQHAASNVGALAANPSRIVAFPDTNCSLGSTSTSFGKLQHSFKGYSDDDLWPIYFPFSFQFLGATYGRTQEGAYVSSNMYVTFGAAMQKLGTGNAAAASNPSLPSIHIGAEDSNVVTALYGGWSGTSYRLRVEGCGGRYNCTNAPDIAFELTFRADSTISLCVVTHARAGAARGGTAGVSDGTGRWIRSFALAPNTRHEFTGFNGAISAGVGMGEGFLGDPINDPLSGAAVFH